MKEGGEGKGYLERVVGGGVGRVMEWVGGFEVDVNKCPVS